MAFSKAAIAALILVGQASATLPSIVQKGSKFFYQNGTQFFIKGVAYQQDSAAAGASTGSNSFSDPLANSAACTRDVPILAALGTNVIRTYAIDPTKDHSACMALLDSYGIYVISDLSEPALSINRDTPGWNTELFARYTAVVDELGKYSNVIGFFAGNEVTNNASNTPASSFVKAAVRDTKAHIKATGSRWMGVGYAANDDADIRANIAQFFNCGNQDEAIDFWGYNIYEWCGHNTFQGSGYSSQVDFFKNYSVPVFFAEYGCNTQGGAEGRIWEETTALYSSDMTGVISGGIVYMYFEEANDFGLVSISGSSASTMKNYNALKTKLASVSPSSTSSAAYTPTNSAAACPAVNKNWAAAQALPPTPDAGLCSCMYNTLSCVPKTGLSALKYGDIFNFICGASAKSCAGIKTDTAGGVFGAYSMCNDTQKLGYVLDQYYKAQSSSSTACDFSGQAVVAKPVAAQSSCSASLSSASAANSVAATATAATATAAKSSNIGAPIPMPMTKLGIFDFAIGLYVLVAMGVGAGMLVL